MTASAPSTQAETSCRGDGLGHTFHIDFAQPHRMVCTCGETRRHQALSYADRDDKPARRPKGSGRVGAESGPLVATGRLKQLAEAAERGEDPYAAKRGVKG